MHLQNTPRQKGGRLRICLGLMMLVVTLCCLAWIALWWLHRTPRDPFSPVELARTRLLRDPFSGNVNRVSPDRRPELNDIESYESRINLDDANSDLKEILNQKASVIYPDVALSDVLDDISSQYNVAIDNSANAGSNVRIVLTMSGPSLRSVLAVILYEADLYCDVEDSVLVIRAGENTPETEDVATHPQGPTATMRSTERASDGGDAPVDPFAPGN